jgi:hypothetical protein
MACCGKAPRAKRPARIKSGIKSGRKQCPLCGSGLRKVHKYDYGSRRPRTEIRCINPSCNYRQKV